MPTHKQHSEAAEFMTRNEIARLGRVSQVTLDTWLRDSWRSRVKVGRRVLIPGEAFIAWLYAHTPA